MNIEPHADKVAVNGPDAPDSDQIDDLIKLLVTIRHRWGNTAVRYSIQWGASALWAFDGQKKQIGELQEGRDQFFKDALVAIAGAVCTPEKGYAVDGGYSQLLADIKALRRSGDDAIADAAEIFRRIRAHNGATVGDVRAAEVWLNNANLAIRR